MGLVIGIGAVVPTLAHGLISNVVEGGGNDQRDGDGAEDDRIAFGAVVDAVKTKA